MVNSSILFIIYDLDRGGPELRLLDLVRHAARQLSIRICVTSENLSLLEEFARHGAAVEVVPVRKAYLQFHKIARIYRYARENRVGIINTYDVKGLIIALAIKFLAPERMAVVHHTVDLLHGYNMRQRVLLRCLLKFVDRSLCNSSSSREILANRFIKEDKITVVYNGVDVVNYSSNDELRAASRKELQFGDEDIVIGTVANFREEKNYPFLIDAFEKIRARNSRIKLVCVGGGKLLDETILLAKKRNLDGQILFTGYVENVQHYLSAMDIFVLCSKKEGFPNALIQAMSMALPVVAARVGGCVEILDDEIDGYLYQSGDTDDFLEKVARFAADGKLRAEMAEKGRCKVNACYALPAMIRNYTEFFQDVARKRSHPHAGLSR